MKVGSSVKTVRDFEQLRKEWGLPYPKVGEILTISKITKHSKKSIMMDSRLNDIKLLHFKEIPELPGLCDKAVDGEINFIEAPTPINDQSHV